MSECSGIFGKIFGHKIKPIFNEIEHEPNAQVILKISQDIKECLMNEKYDASIPHPFEDNLYQFKTVSKTYVKSMCVRCGESFI
jgi:hypothetical protein